MPELPDVEAFRKYFAGTSLRQSIKSVEVKSSRMIKDTSIRTLHSKLKNRKFKSTRRHGKYLIAESEGGNYLVMHFGMTGDLKYYKSTEEEPKYARFIINFTNGYHLAMDDPRKFGAIRLINNPKKFIEKRKLGEDPLTKNFNEKSFRKVLKNKTGTIKSLLMDQKNISGIGNIYSDEILFHSGIHPAVSLKKLNEKKLKSIYVNMKKILKKVISVDADQKNIPSSYLIKHRKAGEKCPKCGGKIARRKIAGRSSYFCAKHQK